MTLKKLTINKKSLGIVVGVMLSIASCSQATPEDNIREARKLLDSQDTQSAVIRLKSALKVAPRNTEARLLLAKTYMNQGQGALAVRDLSRVIEQGENSNIVSRLMVEALMLAHDYQAVTDFISELDRTFYNQQKNFMVFYQSWAFLELGEFDLAMKTTRLVDGSVNDLYADGAHFISAFLLNDTEFTQTYAEALDTRHPPFIDALLLAGKLSYTEANYARTVKLITAYQAQRTQDIAALFILSKALMQVGDTEQANLHISALLSANPNDPMANQLAATLAFQRNKYEQALDYAKKSLLISGNNVQTQLIAGVSAFRLKDYQNTYFYLSPISEYLRRGQVAERMYLISLLMLDKNEEAYELLQVIDEDIDQYSALITQASIGLIEDGDKLKAQTLLAKAGTTNFFGEYQKGIAKVILDDDEGIEILSNLLASQPDNPMVRLSLASAFFKLGDLSQAETLAMEVEGNEELTIRAQTLLAKINLRQNKQEEGVSRFKTILQLAPQHKEANLYFAQAAIKHNEPEQALAFIHAGLASYPTDLTLLTFYTLVQQMLDHPDDAEQQLQKAYTAEPKNTLLGLLLAETLLRQGKPEKSLSVLNKIDANEGALILRFWQLKASVVKQLRKHQEYRDTLVKWQQHFPQQGESYYRLAELYLSHKKLDMAMSIVEAGLQKAPDDESLRFMKANIFIEDKQISKALLYIEELKQGNMDDVLIEGLEGKIHYSHGDYAKALPLVADYYKSYPSIQTALLLRAIYFRQGNAEAANALLKRHIERFPSHNVVRLLLANDVFKRDPQQAKASYIESLKYEPENVTTLYRLGVLLRNDNEAETALEYIQKAYAIDKSNPVILHLAGNLYAELGQDRIAEKRLSQAHELVPKNLTYLIDYAKILVKNKGFDKATKLLDTVENPLPAFGKQIQLIEQQIQQEQ
jgi:putative PEP-CTERM system TPR-repeat lipoprotein